MTIDERRSRLEWAAREILRAIGEDLGREGLAETPRRFADWWLELADYDPGRTDVTFESVQADQLVLVRDLDVWSVCLPSKQIVNAVGGARRAADVKVGDRLWTLADGRVAETTVTQIQARPARALISVETEAGIVTCTPEHPFATPDGWVEASQLDGRLVEWTPPRMLCRSRPTIAIGRDFGYALGAIFSDGTVAKRSVSLVVNDRMFAERYAKALHEAFEIEARVESVSRPSGYLGRQVGGYRVRVVSSYFADLIRMYAGGDAHHQRQRFPRAVLTSRTALDGFLDGYTDGDGFRRSDRDGRVLVSANTSFMADLADIVGSRFTPAATRASQLYIPDRWDGRHGFSPEHHATSLAESRWIPVRSVSSIEASGQKPFTVYSFTCSPYPTFLVGGHLTHNCEHHLLPFRARLTIGYLAADRVLGLSKFGRIAQLAAHKLQLQERLVTEVADEVQRIIGVDDVAVVATGEHLCMTMRGVRMPAAMVTSVLRGRFREPGLRAELMGLAGR